YSMNVIDLCPVGALTSRDFRFKARVWEMSASETICPGCARGCNIYSWVRNNEVLRLTPRLNQDVNESWMCDEGRLTSFRHVNADSRVKCPGMRKDNETVEVGWDEAIARVASEFRAFKKSECAVIVSAYATNEDTFVAQKFARQVLATKRIAFRSHVAEDTEDDILVRADKTPNSRGAREMGIGTGEALDQVLRAIREGQVKALYVIEDNIASDPAVAQLLARLECLVVNATNENETTALADVVLPASTFAEKNGTFTNFEGRVQRIRPSVATLERERSLDGLAMSRLDRFGSPHDRWGRGPKRDARPTWRIIAGIASLMGVKFKYGTSEDVFNELASAFGAFKGMTYRKLGNKGAVLAAMEEKTQSV
ncbi:MAG: molybdopterin-dependent oxidoreductase, partial [Bacteroidetes bacterium]|nr:molybdopterin-dependent oxidoreductase [Bacteroidota bacterium]